MRAAYRIALIFASAFALAFSVLGAAVYVAANIQFQAMRDRDISREIGEMVEEETRARMIDEIDEREAEKLGQRYGYALFERASGRRVGGALAITMPPAGPGWASAAGRSGAAARYRIDAIDLRFGDRLVIGLDSQQIEEVDQAILALFGGAFVVLIIISGAGGLMLGRYLNARLDPVAATARAIVAGDLNRRVPMRGRSDEFEETARAINAMLDRIVRLMKNLRQVSSDIAHDLRTPLMRLRGALDRLETDPDAAAQAVSECEGLLSLFDAILRINEVEGGALAESFVPIDLARLIRELGESYAIAFADEGRELHLDVAPGIAVRGHQELLAQAVANLLDNSRIHTPPGSGVSLRLAAAGGEAVITVADQGSGIAPADRGRMLQRFVRGDDSRSRPGSGLGLSLVAAVVHAHRGEIELADAAPGLVVRLSFPLI
jgi:signal transduction histidine kinase